MRIANLSGRLTLVIDDLAVDVASASGGTFSSDPQAIYESFEKFRVWFSASTGTLSPGVPFDPAALGSPAPNPRQLFAIGSNYGSHGEKLDEDAPPPGIFTKFTSSITGPYTRVRLPDDRVDWEVELVAVVSRPGYQVAAADAWSYIAGLTVGQDLSARTVQMAAKPPQYSLGKSFPGFAPMGPWLVTLDDIDHPEDLELSCAIDGDTVQKGRTSEMMLSVPQLVEQISAVTPLLPGDVIFTGTPAGMGVSLTPQRFLRPGEVLTSSIEQIGELRQELVS